MTKGFKLTERAKSWIDGIRAHYDAGRSSAPRRAEVARKVEVAGFKLL
jgi:hypothetical protein